MNRVWQQAIQASPDPKRAGQYFGHLDATSARAFLKAASADQARVLAALFSGSQALSEIMIAHPDWIPLCLELESLRHPRQEKGLRREVASWLKPLEASGDHTGAFMKLREFKQQEMLRIAARDLGRLASATEITRELSDLADVCLDTAYRLCRQRLVDRFGQPYHEDANGRWIRTEFCVFGMGKLGGQELNYSSDVDLIFVYSEEGCVFRTPPRRSESAGRGLLNHQFFKRLIEAFVAEVTQLTPQGALFRIDLRLRPEGDVGPLARSTSSYENYYATAGQTWERMMLIKARCVAGDAALASEFLDMIQPFRYPRSISERIPEEVAGMKRRIEKEVLKPGEIDRNVKLGRGGIREIEFVVQALQLLNGGRIPFLQNRQTQPTLDKLVQYHLMPQSDADALREAYCFLRDVEHRLQMENNLQTHTIPTERKSRERIAALMGFDSLPEFESKLKEHMDRVRQIYDGLLRAQPISQTRIQLPEFAGHEEEWKTLLATHSFREVESSSRMIETLISGPGYSHLSSRTKDLALELLQRLLNSCPRKDAAGKLSMPKNALSDPDRVVLRLDSFIAAYGTRAMLYETWAANPSLFDLLLLLFDRSEFLAETAIRIPDLVDELELSGQLRRKKTAGEILDDLRHGIEDEDQKLWLRRYHRTELMRIGLRDILGLADFEQNLTELSALADACLQYAFEVAARATKLAKAPVAIVGLGKLGGAELNYGSDLDIIFVADPKVRNLPQLQRLAVDVMGLLAEQTEAGSTFATDARLRPDGEKGLLVNTLAAYEAYYRQRAMLWEIQSLARARPIAGDVELGRWFQRLAETLTDFRPENLVAEFRSHTDDRTRPRSARRNRKVADKDLVSVATSGLAAYRPDWKQEIAAMRARIEKERTPPGKNPLAIKTGAGGLIDAEFIAQTICLENGWHEPNTLRALTRAREHQTLPATELDSLISNYRQLRRIEGILRRWSFAGETVLPEDPAPLRRVAIRCGYTDADSFMTAVGDCRTAIRSVYSKIFASSD